MYVITDQKQSGFTLVELIVVIVILGILAATALPKFINISADARKASIQAMTGALNSSVTLAQAKYYASGDTTAVAITLQDGTTADVIAGTGTTAGFPTSGTATSGIIDMLQDISGYTVTYVVADNTTTFRPSGSTAVTCQVVYDSDDGSVTETVTTC